MIDYKKYPKDWKTRIRPDILKRAGNKCEMCGVANYEYGYRDKLGRFYSSDLCYSKLEDTGYDYFDTGNELDHCWKKDGNPTQPIKIVLTIAHLDHDINNNDYGNLKALCQRCHLNYDKEHHKKNSNTTRRNKKNNYEISF